MREPRDSVRLRIATAAVLPGKGWALIVLLLVLSDSRAATVSTIGFQQPVDYPAGTDPCGVIAADFNGDGKMDLAVGDHGDPNVGDDGGVKLLLGNGDGTFQAATSVAAGKNPCPTHACLVSADFNADGKLDLAVLNSDDTVSVLLGKGDGSFQPHVDYRTSHRSTELLLGDLNGDHRPDLIILVQESSVSTLLGNGDGTFQAEVIHSTESQPTGLTAFDVNGDGRLDLVMTVGGQGIETLFGNGDATFQPGVYCTCGARGGLLNGITPLEPTQGADFNQDGHLDLAVMFFDSTNQSQNQFLTQEKILLGNGDGTFTPTGTPLRWPHPAGFAGVVADLSGDGHADVAITFDPLVMLFGDGSGKFQLANFASGREATSIAVSDINGDSFPDVIVTNFGLGTISVLLNTTRPVAVLGVNLTGNGSGTVTSTPPGINCPGACSVPFDSGTAVSLTATASSGSTFSGWSGICSGTGGCNMTINADQSVTATFNSPDFSVSTTTPAPASVAAGQSASSTVSLTSVGGLSGSVNLTCSVDPALTLAPACSFHPASLMLPANGSVNSTLTISTTLPAMTMGLASPEFVQFRTTWFVALGFALVGIGSRARREGKPSRPGCLWCSLLLAGLLIQAACAGGSVHRGSSAGTPKGQYTITVAGASGSLQHSTAVSLTVQ